MVYERGTYVWSTVAKNHISLPTIQLGRHEATAFCSRNVRNKSLDVADGANRQQIHTQNDGSSRHVLGRNLAPASWSRAQVDAYPRLGQKVEALVDLDELERSARAVALVLGQVVVLVLVVPLLVGRHGHCRGTPLPRLHCVDGCAHCSYTPGRRAVESSVRSAPSGWLRPGFLAESLNLRSTHRQRDTTAGCLLGAEAGRLSVFWFC